MSAEASDMSGWLLRACPASRTGAELSDAFWTMAGLAIGTYLNWLLVAKGCAGIPSLLATRSQFLSFSTVVSTIRKT
jgi:hypothetical protein